MDLAERGERFRINHPAYTVPDKPSKPNRLLIMIDWICFGTGCAVDWLRCPKAWIRPSRRLMKWKVCWAFRCWQRYPCIDSPREKRLRRFRRAADGFVPDRHHPVGVGGCGPVCHPIGRFVGAF
jgi:hypothetical protein